MEWRPLCNICKMIFDEKTKMIKWRGYYLVIYAKWSSVRRKNNHVEWRPLCNICICLSQPGKADTVGPAPSWLVETILVMITMKLISMAEMAVLFVLISRTSRLNILNHNHNQYIIVVWSKLTIITITINMIVVWSRLTVITIKKIVVWSKLTCRMREPRETRHTTWRQLRPFVKGLDNHEMY